MRRLFLGLALAALIVPASAQQNPNDKNTRLDVQDLNFDLWCQQTEGLPPDRCDKRTDEDNAKFEAYRASYERYEIPYLQQKKAGQNLSNILIHPDPVPSENPASHPTDREIASPKPNP